ncbi:MEMO1 family [Phakopsora pachyrhizi]|nr:MEMO1 family [Phakopsora pachyrhizi]KAI8461906.1 MEMO1 family [Phakopsora pachyrhizi]
MTRVRSPTHAGSWYSSSPSKLKDSLRSWLDQAHTPVNEPEDSNQSSRLNEEQGWKSVCVDVPLKGCRAIIAPHAGYAYSGRAAAWAYKVIDPTEIKRVFVLGPSHHLYLQRCALTKCDVYDTPIGSLPVDKSINNELRETGMFDQMSLRTDEDEHSIELHLPYIRQVFKDHDIKIVPILVGSISSDQELEYGELLAPYLSDRENFFVISSDFCHWGSRFSYTYFRDPESSDNKPINLSSIETSEFKSPCPIHRSIEALDKEAIDLISLSRLDLRVVGDLGWIHERFTSYLRRTKNTICGRHPIGILLGSVISLRSYSVEDSQTGGSEEVIELRFVRYEQSSQCITRKDSSVSYASGFLTII